MYDIALRRVRTFVPRWKVESIQYYSCVRNEDIGCWYNGQEENSQMKPR